MLSRFSVRVHGDGVGRDIEEAIRKIWVMEGGIVFPRARAEEAEMEGYGSTD